MIGIIVPAHNERDAIAGCLASLVAAARYPGLNGEKVQIVVVCDACSESTEAVARCYPVQLLIERYKNVGMASNAGADHLIHQGARWLAFTDADTEVPETWLMDQLRFGCDAVCGTVRVADWSAHPPTTKERYESLYSMKEGHRHIHGANLGVSVVAYRKVGGFKPLRVHEDVHLIADLTAAGASISWTTVNCVTTSARPESRCEEGFGAYLRSLAPGAPSNSPGATNPPC